MNKNWKATFDDDNEDLKSHQLARFNLLLDLRVLPKEIVPLVTSYLDYIQKFLTCHLNFKHWFIFDCQLQDLFHQVQDSTSAHKFFASTNWQLLPCQSFIDDGGPSFKEKIGLMRAVPSRKTILTTFNTRAFFLCTTKTYFKKLRGAQESKSICAWDQESICAWEELSFGRCSDFNVPDLFLTKYFPIDSSQTMNRRVLISDENLDFAERELKLLHRAIIKGGEVRISHKGALVSTQRHQVIVDYYNHAQDRLRIHPLLVFLFKKKKKLAQKAQKNLEKRHKAKTANIEWEEEWEEENSNKSDERNPETKSEESEQSSSSGSDWDDEEEEEKITKKFNPFLKFESFSTKKPTQTAYQPLKKKKCQNVQPGQPNPFGAACYINNKIWFFKDVVNFGTTTSSLEVLDCGINDIFLENEIKKKETRKRKRDFIVSQWVFEFPNSSLLPMDRQSRPFVGLKFAIPLTNENAIWLIYVDPHPTLIYSIEKNTLYELPSIQSQEKDDYLEDLEMERKMYGFLSFSPSEEGDASFSNLNKQK